jgi:hypothetical protein
MFVDSGQCLHKGTCPRCSSVAAAAALLLPISGHTQKFGPFIFSNLRILFPARNLQPSLFHALAHSFAHDRKLTHASPVTSTLFLRSLAQERKSTPLLSTACARFCRNGGWGVNKERKSASIQALSSRSTRGNRLGRPGSARPSQNKGAADKIDTGQGAPYAFKTGIYSKPRRRSYGPIRGNNQAPPRR